MEVKIGENSTWRCSPLRLFSSATHRRMLSPEAKRWLARQRHLRQIEPYSIERLPQGDRFVWFGSAFISVRPSHFFEDDSLPPQRILHLPDPATFKF
jgi:hypothetical protein